MVRDIELPPEPRADRASAAESLALSLPAVPLPAVPLPAVPLARRTVTGLLWLASQTLGGKLIAIGGQIVLARFFLQAHDFGLVSLSLTFAFFASQIQQAGIREVIVRRPAAFESLAGAAFRCALGIGGAMALLLALVAPAVARAYGDPSLCTLIRLTALGCPCGALALVPSARLQVNLRFRELALVALTQSVLTTALTIVMAALNLQSYAVVGAQVAASAVNAAVLLVIGRPPASPGRRRGWVAAGNRGAGPGAGLGLGECWRLVVPALPLVGATLASGVISQGDYLALGLFHDAASVGRYYFAFTLSGQVVVLLGANMLNVLFPALSRLQDDPGRQLRAFLTAARLLAVVGLPVCIFQAAFAPQIIHLLFGGRWDAAAPVFRILSIGTGFRLVAGAGHGAMRAQGRFGTFFIWTLANSLTFAAIVLLASYAGGTTAVAVGVTASMMVFEPLLVLLSVWPLGGGVADVRRIFAAPLAAGVTAALAGLAVIHLGPSPRLPLAAPLRDAGQIAVAALFAVPTYLLALRVLARETLAECVLRLRQLLGRKTARRGAGPAKLAVVSAAPAAVALARRAA